MVSNKTFLSQNNKTNTTQPLPLPHPSSRRHAPVAPFLPTKNSVRRGANNRNARLCRRSSNVQRGLRNRRAVCLNPAGSTRQKQSAALASSTTCTAPVDPAQHAHPDTNEQTSVAPCNSYYANKWHPIHRNAGKPSQEHLEQAAREDAAQEQAVAERVTLLPDN